MKSKTVLLIRNAAAYDFGGAETYQTNIAGILKESSFHPIIVSGSIKLRNHADRHSVQTIRGWWWAFQNWSGVRILLTPLYVAWQAILMLWYITLIIRVRASVLHIQSKDDFIAATIAGRVMGRKVVWTDHMDLRYIFENLSHPLRNPVGKLVFWAAHLAHHIIIISDNEHRLITAHFKKPQSLQRQIVIVKNGVIDRKKSYSSTKKKNSAFTFCIASRLVINKGVGETIEAFTLLSDHLSDPRAIVLDIYGEGADASLFKSIAANRSNIVFHGHQQDAIGKVNEADVFILPSYQEGFSIALLEATMLGKAIIATNVDSNGEIIEHLKTGLLVEPKNSRDLYEAMRTLYDNHKLKEVIGMAARKKYEEYFNLEQIVQNKILPLYNS